MKIAYIKFSGSTRNEDKECQIKKLRALGIEERFIFIDKTNGINRPYSKTLHADDILHIDSLDRLGRDYDGIIREWKHITMVIKADIVTLDMEGLFDRRKFRQMGDMGKLMEDQFFARSNMNTT